jgi:GNAT superfamily N-acetyltransferase
MQDLGVRVNAIPYDHPDAVALISELQQEYVTRYGSPDATPVDPAEFAPPDGLFLVGYRDGLPVASGGWRVFDVDAAELKRMYVRPTARGLGLARSMLAELERTAREAGRRRMMLESGMHQPEALALYRSSGYAEVPKFGHYADAPSSVHLGKWIASTVEEPVCPSTP